MQWTPGRTVQFRLHCLNYLFPSDLISSPRAQPQCSKAFVFGAALHCRERGKERIVDVAVFGSRKVKGNRVIRPRVTCHLLPACPLLISGWGVHRTTFWQYHLQEDFTPQQELRSFYMVLGPHIVLDFHSHFCSVLLDHPGKIPPTLLTLS